MEEGNGGTDEAGEKELANLHSNVIGGTRKEIRRHILAETDNEINDQSFKANI
jgi:hypothetical protein